MVYNFTVTFYKYCSQENCQERIALVLEAAVGINLSGEGGEDAIEETIWDGHKLYCAYTGPRVDEEDRSIWIVPKCKIHWEGVVVFNPCCYCHCCYCHCHHCLHF